jgi:hypothetical protein
LTRSAAFDHLLRMKGMPSNHRMALKPLHGDDFVNYV